MMKKKNIFVRVSVMLMVTILLFTGCGANTNSNKELNLAVLTPPNSLHNVRSTELSNTQIIENYMEGLVVLNLKGEYEAAGAEKWTISEDGLTYTFNLRKTNWSNGTPVTAHDYVFSWRQSVLDDKASYTHYQKYLKNGEKVIAGELPIEDLAVRAIDDYTLEATLESPKSYYLSLLASVSLFPINEAFFNEIGGTEVYGTSVDTVLANGAYKLTTFQGDTGYTLEKRAEYWDEKNVNVPKVNVKVIKEATTRASMWEAGELDEVYLTGDLIDKYATDPLLIQEEDNAMYYMYISPFVHSDEGAMFENKNLRRAIAYGIDKEQIANKVLKNGSLPADYLLPTSILSEKGTTFREEAGTFNELYFNTEKANEFFQTALTELGQDSITITITVDDAERNVKLFENIKAQLEQNISGLKVEIKTMPAQIYFKTLYKFETPAARFGWSTDLTDPTTHFSLFTSNSSNNFSQVSLPEYDALIDKTENAESMLNAEQRFVDMVRAEQMLLEEYYHIPLFQQGKIKLVRKGVTGLVSEHHTQNYRYRWVKIS